MVHGYHFASTGSDDETTEIAAFLLEVVHQQSLWKHQTDEHGGVRSTEGPFGEPLRILSEVGGQGILMGHHLRIRVSAVR